MTGPVELAGGQRVDGVLPREQPAGVIVKSGVQAVESSGDLIDPCHLDTIFKFNSSNHLGQVVEST